MANVPIRNSLPVPASTPRSPKHRAVTFGGAIHIAIHNSVAYGVLPMTYGAVRALPCR